MDICDSCCSRVAGLLNIGSAVEKLARFAGKGGSVRIVVVVDDDAKLAALGPSGTDSHLFDEEQRLRRVRHDLVFDNAHVTVLGELKSYIDVDSKLQS